MVGKFDSTIYFKYGTNNLDVCGPIFWDIPADNGLTIRVEVVLKQGNQTVSGVSAPPLFAPMDPEWMVIIGTTALVPGTAIGKARALDAQGHEVATWRSPVRIDRQVTFVAVRDLIVANANGVPPEIGEAPPQREWEEFFEQAWPSDSALMDAVTR